MSKEHFQQALTEWKPYNLIGWNINGINLNEYRTMYSFTCLESCKIDFNDKYLVTKANVDEKGDYFLFNIADSQGREYKWRWPFYKSDTFPFILLDRIQEVLL